MFVIASFCLNLLLNIKKNMFLKKKKKKKHQEKYITSREKH